MVEVQYIPPNPFDFAIDLERGTVTYRAGGLVCPIRRMFDEYGECTLDHTEAVAIVFAAPGALVGVSLDLDPERLS